MDVLPEFRRVIAVSYDLNRSYIDGCCLTSIGTGFLVVLFEFPPRLLQGKAVDSSLHAHGQRRYPMRKCRGFWTAVQTRNAESNL